jgi:uncharacterized protein (TIGR02246 family)
MSDDERAIAEVVQTWMDASRRGDVATVLSLMTDDVVFMVPGQEPFGKAAFAAASAPGAAPQIEGTAEIVEMQVLGDWAFVRNRIELTVTPADGAPARRGGYTLTLLRKEADGRWRLARDANVVVARD